MNTEKEKIETMNEQSVEVLEGNKLIAEFMNWKHHEDKEYDNHEISNLKYHSSWDWLHGAIEKAHDECKLYPAGLKFFDGLTIFSTINQVLERLVQFINWYNQNKQS